MSVQWFQDSGDDYQSYLVVAISGHNNSLERPIIQTQRSRLNATVIACSNPEYDVISIKKPTTKGEKSLIH